MPEEVSDNFWFNDYTILFRSDRLLDFFPTPNDTNAEKLNSITRFGIYSSIILTIYNKNYRYLSIIFLVLLLTYFIYNTTVKEQEQKEAFSAQTEYTLPTLNNPFGNPSVVDFLDNPDKPPMIDYSDNTDQSKEIRKAIEDKFSYNLYQDVNDIYSKNLGRREYYTVASTTNPPDADGKLRDWCFGGARSCKTNQKDCLNYEDPRNRKSLYTISEE